MKMLCRVSLLMVVFWLSVDADQTVEKKKESVWDLVRKQSPRRGDIDLSKPGSCPSELDVSKQSPSVCAFDCVFDMECPGTQRCCQDDCGGATCVETTELEVSETEKPTTLNQEADTATEQPTTINSNTDKSTVSSLKTETAKTSTIIFGGRTDVTKPQTTISTARTTEATTPTSNSGDPELFIDGDANVNVLVVEGGNIVLRCNISASSPERPFVFWMVIVDGGYHPLSDVSPTGNKKVSHEGAWLEILGATPEDSRSFVCFGGHSTGYLTQTYAVTVTEKTGGTVPVSHPDSCASHVCSNGGTCIEGVGQSYRCICSDGYQGNYCTVAVDPCHSNSCQNGATCVRTESGVSCQCPAGWEGTHCEDRTSLCSSNPCRNGGYCIDKIQAFQCACPPNFTGAQCEEAVASNEAAEAVTTPAPTTEPISDVCYLPLDTGSCSRKENKWYYDIETQQCQPFVYSGCQGNANRFRSYDECQWECPRLPRDPCSHPIVTGRCKARIPRWAYSTHRQICIEFVYGGCAPTGNNFQTREECTQTCILDTQQPCSCVTPGLHAAFCNSDFVITGIVRRQLLSSGQLKSVVLELTKTYKGFDLMTLRRSRFFDAPLLVTKSRSQESNRLESNRCRNRCFEDFEDGVEYILTGTLTREGGSKNTVAYLTSRSYVKRAVSRRLDKLDRMSDDKDFIRRCSFKLENPLQ